MPSDAPLAAVPQIQGEQTLAKLWVHLPESWKVAGEPQGATTFSWWQLHEITNVQRRKKENKRQQTSILSLMTTLPTYASIYLPGAAALLLASGGRESTSTSMEVSVVSPLS